MIDDLKNKAFVLTMSHYSHELEFYTYRETNHASVDLTLEQTSKKLENKKSNPSHISITVNSQPASAHLI
jgi:hypothetical protein